LHNISFIKKILYSPCKKLIKCNVIFFLVVSWVPGVVVYIQYLVKTTDFPFRIFGEFRNNSVVICCFFRHLQPKPSAPRIPISFWNSWRILTGKTRWLVNYFGILQEFLKISAAVCISDKILTGKVDGYQETAIFFLGYLLTSPVEILSEQQTAVEFF